MAALDTNVVVRLMVGDDAAQARAAEKLVASEPCTVCPTVLMECEWVLRGCYALDAPTIDACFRSFLALEHISAADPVLTQRTLDGYSAGMDFSDAMHAAQSKDGERFFTFDKVFAKRASKAGFKSVFLLKS
jgi:predicted nucleic-acid-binding protein